MYTCVEQINWNNLGFHSLILRIDVTVHGLLSVNIWWHVAVDKCFKTACLVSTFVLVVDDDAVITI